MNAPDIKDMKYGLVVVDKRELEKSTDGFVPILHFCGYWNPPTQENINQLHAELAATPEFGVSDIMEHIGIYTAPESLVEEYRNDIIAGSMEPVAPDSTEGEPNNA